MRKSLILMLSAVMLTLASCKKTIDNQNKEEEKQTCTLISANDDGSTFKISYDDKGRVISESELSDSWESTTTYTYSATQISEKIVDVYGNNTRTYYENYLLDNTGKIISSTSSGDHNTYSKVYTYNSDGYLESKVTSWDINNINSENYTWVNGNLSAETSSETVKYEYSSQALPKNFYHGGDAGSLPIEFIGPLRNYFGKSAKMLPSKRIEKDRSDFYKYSVDLNGNLTSIDWQQGESLSTYQYSCK